MKFGAWFHGHDDLPLEQQLVIASAVGIRSARSYSFEYARKLAPGLQQNGMSLLAGIHVDSEALLADWRTQFRPDLLEAYHSLGVPLEGICIGNELREGGGAPEKKRFTARLAFGLANVIRASRQWLDEHGLSTPLTYAMEEIMYDQALNFQEFVFPLFDSRTRNDRLAAFNYRLRRALTQIEAAGKPALLSETGFPSAIGYHREGERMVIPESDGERYGQVMAEFIGVIQLCDHTGRPKFDIQQVLNQ